MHMTTANWKTIFSSFNQVSEYLGLPIYVLFFFFSPGLLPFLEEMLMSREMGGNQPEGREDSRT